MSKIAMMTAVIMLLVTHAVEHATIPMEEMISITDIRICTARKAVENAATQRVRWFPVIAIGGGA